jgi:hypothetical protein
MLRRNAAVAQDGYGSKAAVNATSYDVRSPADGRHGDNTSVVRLGPQAENRFIALLGIQPAD